MKPIHIYHIEKTGGRNLRNMIAQKLVISQGLDEKTAKSLVKSWVGGEFNGIPKKIGDFWLGGKDSIIISNHENYYTVIPRPGEISITLIRDPIDRIISYYRMTLTDISNYKQETWAEFVKNCPLNTLMRHLSMFSKTMDVDEAFNIITKLNYVIMLDDYEFGAKKLFKELNLNFNKSHMGKSKCKIDTEVFYAQEDVIEILKTKISLELELYNRLKIWYNNRKKMTEYKNANWCAKAIADANDNLNRKYFKTKEYLILQPYQEINSAFKDILKQSKKRPLNVIDIGCGCGWQAVFFKEEGFMSDIKFSGADVSKHMCDRAKKNYPDGDFFVHNIVEKPLNKSYDIVFESATLELVSDWEAALKNMLKSSNEWFIAHRMWYTDSNNTKIEQVETYNRLPDIRIHISLREFKSIINSEGFSIVRESKWSKSYKMGTFTARRIK